MHLVTAGLLVRCSTCTVLQHTSQRVRLLCMLLSKKIGYASSRGALCRPLLSLSLGRESSLIPHPSPTNNIIPLLSYLLGLVLSVNIASLITKSPIPRTRDPSRVGAVFFAPVERNEFFLLQSPISSAPFSLIPRLHSYTFPHAILFVSLLTLLQASRVKGLGPRTLGFLRSIAYCYPERWCRVHLIRSTILK